MKSKNSDALKENTIAAMNENRTISHFKKRVEAIPQVSSSLQSEIKLQ